MLTLEQVLAKSTSRLNGLNPKVKTAGINLITNCYKRGVMIIVVQGYRSIQAQSNLYAQGRTTPGPIVTNAKGGDSFHNYRVAIDFAILDKVTGKKIIWDTKIDQDKDKVADWTEVLVEARKLGFECGADFKTFKDMPHLQMRFGLTLADYKAGKRPK